SVRGRPRRMAAHPLSPVELYAVSSNTEVDMDWMEYGFNGADAIRVVISCIAFYFGITLLLRIFGQRTLASLSSFDLAAIIAMGATIGRAILGDTPTLGAGTLGLATLLRSEERRGGTARGDATSAIAMT